MVARGYFQLAKLCPIGIYLKDLQTAPTSRLWKLSLIHELCSDLQIFCPLSIDLMVSQFGTLVVAMEDVRPVTQTGAS